MSQEPHPSSRLQPAKKRYRPSGDTLMAPSFWLELMGWGKGTAFCQAPAESFVEKKKSSSRCGVGSSLRYRRVNMNVFPSKERLGRYSSFSVFILEPRLIGWNSLASFFKSSASLLRYRARVAFAFRFSDMSG